MTNSESRNHPEQKRYEPNYQLSLLISIVIGILLVGISAGYSYYFSGRIGPGQPIPFSHRIHAGDKQISCVFCHAQAIDTDVAGVPPMETCMLCHSKIIIHYPQIAKIRDSYYKKTPIQWNRVNVLQEFVFFSHQGHVQSGVDCGYCHGDVKQMDRVSMKKPFQMGFCVQCHRDTQVSHDCLMCHR
jgi:hypothetical protein